MVELLRQRRAEIQIVYTFYSPSAEQFAVSVKADFSDFLPFGLKRFVAAKLMASPWFARHVVVDRWFLHSHEPALA